MNPTEQALLATAIADPDNDLPRLVLADWWDENGQPERAEFCRLQIELARMRAGGCPNCCYGLSDEMFLVCDTCRPKYLELLRREWEIQCGHSAWWSDYGPGDRFTVIEWRRGFVHSLACPAADWLACGDEVLKRHPVRKVRLRTAPDIPNGNWDHTPPHVSRGAQFEIAGEMVEAPPYGEWCYPDHLAGRTNEWHCEMLRRRWPGVDFELPPEPREDWSGIPRRTTQEFVRHQMARIERDIRAIRAMREGSRRATVLRPPATS